MSGKTFAAGCAVGLALVVGVPSCLVYNHLSSRSEKTRDIGTADYVLENYRWFKGQEADIGQVNAQISSMKVEISDYVIDFKGSPRAEWPFDAREELARKESVLRGYMSQYNMLAGDYNERVSYVTRGWTRWKGKDAPDELESYIKTYDKK